jgi:hypothetical protein
LTLAREAIGEAVPIAHLTAENALLREISQQQALLRASQLDDGAREKAAAALAASEAKLTSLRLRLATERPAVAHVRYPRLWSATAVQRELLSRGETLVLYYVGRRRSAAWVVRPDRIDVHRLPARGAIEAAVRRYLEVASAPGGADLEGARALGSMLLPALDGDASEGTRVIIAPHGILQYLPFEALADRSGRYLIEKYNMAYVPSVSSLGYLRHAPATRTRGRRIVAVGNPVMSGAAAADRQTQIDWMNMLRPLPHTREELRRIASIFGGAGRILEQEDANETALAASLADAGILHFATHGLVDEEQPDRSGLALTVRSPDSDGLLQMREIYRLRIPATLVT